MSKSSKTEDPHKDANATDKAGGVTSCKVPCTITSETVATQPTNKTRLKIGAGEEVDLTVSPGTATWTATPSDLIELPTDAGTASSTTIRIKALDKAGSITITAKTNKCECSIQLTIVIPSEMKMRRLPSTSIIHYQGYVTCGFFGQAYILPDDVNFYNVSIRELDDLYQTSGAFARAPGYHGNYPASQEYASEWISLTYQSGIGNVMGGYDTVYAGHDKAATGSPPTYPPGEVIIPIRWQWAIGVDPTATFTGTKHDFPQIEHKTVADSSGKCTTSKGGTTVTTEVNDSTSGFNPTTGEIDVNF